MHQLLIQASPEAIKLVNLLLQWNPARRPSAQQALKYIVLTTTFPFDIYFKFFGSNSPKHCCSHSFFSRSHHSTSSTQQSSGKQWINMAGRLASTSTASAVKFLGPGRVLPTQQPAGVRLKLASEAGLHSDRQVVQSEPTRPKPEWPGTNEAASLTKNAKDAEDDDGFEDIFQ